MNEVIDVDLHACLADTRRILETLDLDHDAQLQDQLSLVEITLEGMSVNLPETTTKVREHLAQVHGSAVISSLHEILNSALGYYSIVEQLEGQNEPILGPEEAVSLIRQLKRQPHDIMAIKDQLFRMINAEEQD